jgi:iron(III) transport system ATP-binding protein
MLKVQGLAKSFAGAGGAVKVIDGVNFEVPEGECYALLGPSGCGKTTTLRCVAGLEHADAGTITIGGRTVSDPANGVFVQVHERAIGMVFQSYAIWPHLDVLENVAYPLRIRRPRLPKAEIRDRVMAALQLVGMETMGNRSATSLSGGQQQRVALARAIVRRPALLLLDEPLSNLDARMRDQMRIELHDLINKVGVTALYVTHDQAEAFALAHRVAVMSQGRIVQEGSPRAIYQQPRTSFVATFLGAANVLRARLEALDCGSGVFALDGESRSRIKAPISGEWAAGDQAEIVIRPENLRVHADRPGQTENVMLGRIAALTFLGGQCECAIDLGESVVRAVIESTREVAQGAAVWLTVDPARCIALRKKV